MTKLIEQAREAIKKNKFSDFKEEISKIYKKSDIESKKNYSKFNVSHQHKKKL
jgi:queuine/archaeosine tRNA-ribosyltransferase